MSHQVSIDLVDNAELTPRPERKGVSFFGQRPMVKTKKPLDGGPNGRTSADTIAAEIGALTFQMTRWQRPNESLSLLFLLRLLLTPAAPTRDVNSRQKEAPAEAGRGLGSSD